MGNEFRFPNIATPPGSTAYYLVRFSPEYLRDRQAVLFAWRRELQRLFTSSDPGVARLKLDYWRNELQPDQLAHSRHPLAQMIHTHLSGSAAQLSALADITETQILAGQCRDWKSFQDRCEEIGGRFSSLLTSAHTQDDEHQSTASRIGMLDEATRQLQRVGRKEYQQRLPLLDEQRATRQLLEWIEQLQQQAAELDGKKIPGPANAQLAITNALLETFSLEPSLLLEATVDLTPIRKLWLVWRNRAQMRQ